MTQQKSAEETKDTSRMMTIEPEIGGMVSSDVMNQIEVAKKFPRSIDQFRKKAVALATFSQETAAQCFYAIKRGGQMIEGPSVRLAEICVTSYGNIRCQASIVAEDDRFITARGIAWDLESNAAASVDVQRRITTRDGKKYSEDMIAVTANAACAIAFRNAAFKIVPAIMTQLIYDEARKTAVGDVKSLSTRVDHMFKAFALMGVNEDTVIKKLGLKGRDDIDTRGLTTMLGVYNAIKDGDTTVEEQFNSTPRSAMAGAFSTNPETANKDTEGEAP